MDKTFEQAVAVDILEGYKDQVFQRLSQEWMQRSGSYRYSYRQRFMGVPIIQLPADLIAIQSLIWEIKPTLIIETGIARGGSLIMSAAFLALLDLADHRTGRPALARRVLGIDIHIRPHTREALASCPFSDCIHTLQASSTSREAGDFVRAHHRPGDVVMVLLDSNHTHDHVMAELNLYQEFVTPGSYIVAFDTSIEFDDPSVWVDKRPWGPGNSPHSAVSTFLRTETGANFEIDRIRHMALELTVCRDGFLKRKTPDGSDHG